MIVILQLLSPFFHILLIGKRNTYSMPLDERNAIAVLFIFSAVH